MVGESQEAVGVGAGSGPSSNKTPTLEEYGTNLTTQAKEVRPPLSRVLRSKYLPERTEESSRWSQHLALSMPRGYAGLQQDKNNLLGNAYVMTTVPGRSRAVRSHVLCSSRSLICQIVRQHAHTSSCDFLGGPADKGLR